MDDWMLIDRHQSDFSGRTCNKIGVSYTAFRVQHDGCLQPPERWVFGRQAPLVNTSLPIATSHPQLPG